MSAESTDTVVRVIVVGIARCPTCNKQIELRREISDVEIHHSIVSPLPQTIESVRQQVDVHKRQHGWSERECGDCRKGKL